MKFSHFIFPLPALWSASVLAGTVLYTDSQHMPNHLPTDVMVVPLDAPEQLQAQFFGSLSADPVQAAAQVKQVMASPRWAQQQQQLAHAYQQVVKAWELGVSKVPAVVFDERDVVYGTTDIVLATALRQQAGGQP
ncbi:TIGR03757 family integrating conjugative element protein [Serratia microhaemolytica]|uniref:TIGR03757 family integrating conjugative element protein n=1 Tax=Serratia microhaemolytica TaxID=2675110 RepID=UPI000FDD346A|nr:TIGR03757 family integrating conjugative element protein [Serratia microhaemolytica]